MKKVITPEFATTLLKHNNRNRTVQPRLVSELSNAITKGNFKYNGEAIIVSEEGNLLDGQHRLLACIRAGMSMECEIVYNVPEDVMPTIDTGVARTAGHVLSMYGYTQYNMLAAMARIILKFNKKQVDRQAKGTSRYSNAEVLEFCNENPDLEEYIAVKKKVLNMTRSELSFYNYVFLNCDPYSGEDFMGALISGENLQFGNPVFILRELMIKDMNSLTKYSLKQRMKFVFFTYDRYIKNREVKRLTPKMGEKIIYPADYPFYD